MARTKRYIKPASIKKLEKLAAEIQQDKYPNFPYPPPKKYRDDKSNDLTRCVIDWIKFNGYQAERINSTGRQLKIKGESRWIKGSSQKGTADISATIKGRSVKIEIKCTGTGDRYQSKDQKKYQSDIESAGGIYIVVRDFNHFYSWYKRFVR